MTNPIMGLVALLTVHVLIVWVHAFSAGSMARRQAPAPPVLTKDAWPVASVIIPAWRECGTVARCLNSLRSVDYEQWEVIVVAGGPDGTFEEACRVCRGWHRCTVIEQRPHGKNAALNQGMELARGDVIVILDADSIVGAGWLRAMVAPLTSKVGASTGYPLPLRKTPIARAEEMERISTLFIHGVTTLNGSGSISIKRDVLDQMAGFPEEVLVGVDWDLDARLAARGVVRELSPSAFVETERPANIREFWHNEVRWRRAHILSIIRLLQHFPTSARLIVSSLYIYALPWLIVLSGSCALFALLDRPGEVTTFVGITWIAVVAWILLRRVAVAIEVFSFTRQKDWLAISWVPPCLLLLVFGSAVTAVLTLNRNKAHFKGPRARFGESYER